MIIYHNFCLNLLFLISYEINVKNSLIYIKLTVVFKWETHSVVSSKIGDTCCLHFLSILPTTTSPIGKTQKGIYILLDKYSFLNIWACKFLKKDCRKGKPITALALPLFIPWASATLNG